MSSRHTYLGAKTFLCVRVLEIIVPKKKDPKLDKVLKEDLILKRWTYTGDDGETIIKVLTQEEHAKELLAALEKDDGDYRVVIYPVEGTLPKLTDEEKAEGDKMRVGYFFTISKEELYSDIDDPVDLSANFIIMVILSSFVAGVGILKDSVPILIGAMVIAPFLGPNMSLAFGTTLGDWDIMKKSLITGIVAIMIGVVISVLWGYFTSDLSEITQDDNIAIRDVLLALACGFVGVISVVSGSGTTLVGVMVAAALLPPLIRAGLLLGGAFYAEATNSFLVFSANIICVNIAGIVTFYLAGIRPQRWWEKEKAEKHTRRAFIIWIIALGLLVTGIFLLRKFLPED